MLNRQTAETKKKDSGHHTAHDAAGRRTLRPVLLRYAIAQSGYKGLKLLHVPLSLDEEALVVFSSWETAQRYYVSRRHFLSEVFSGEWHVRACSAGEMVSLLLGPYEGLEWVLLDPQPGVRVVAGSTQANLMSRKWFADQLLE
jgi:hypothetical protein